MHLSDLGKTTFQKSLPTLFKIIDELQQGISDNEIALTIKVLNQIQNNICKKLKNS